MKNLILTICYCCILTSSCSQSNEIKKEDNLIMSKIIDDFSFPMPPPPQIGSEDTIIPNRIVDSLVKIKMNVAIYPLMESSIDEQGRKEIPKKFNKIINTSLKLKSITTIDEIISEKEHSIALADTIELKKSYDFNQFKLLYNFSRIWYNNDKTIAVLEVGVSKSKLSGYGTILCLEKIKGKWSTVKSIPTTTW